MRWKSSEGKSTEVPKNSYLINYCGEIFIVEATAKEIQSALKMLKNIRAWKCKEVKKNIKEWGDEEVEQEE